MDDFTADLAVVDDLLHRDALRQAGLDPDRPIDPQYRGKRHVTATNILGFIETIGIAHTALLTLTFRHPIDHAEAAERFEVFRRHFRHRFGRWIKIIEKTVHGYLHLHLVIEVADDIVTGTDLAAMQRYYDVCKAARTAGHPLSWSERRGMRNDTTTNAFLLELWAELDRVAPKLGFGWEVDLAPIRNPPGVAHYLAKDLVQRQPFYTKKGRKVQAIRYSRGCPRKLPPRQGRSPWFEQSVRALLGACGRTNEAYFADRYGEHWHYHVGKNIGPRLHKAAGNWHWLPAEQLARLIIAQCKRDWHLRFFCERIMHDLLQVASVESPPPPPPSVPTPGPSDSPSTSSFSSASSAVRSEAQHRRGEHEAEDKDPD